MVDLSGLVNFADQAPVHGSWLEARNGGTILTGQLVALSGVEVRLNAMGTLNLPALRSVVDSVVTVAGLAANWSGVTNLNQSVLTLEAGGTMNLAQASQVDGATFLVQSGTTLELPQVMGYDAPELDSATFRLRASGAGSVLRLPHLTNVIGDGMHNSYVVIEALAGGRVELPAVAQMTQPYNGGYSSYPRGIQVLADGTNSMVDLSGLVSFADQAPVHGSWLEARNGGTILAGQLVALSGVEVRLNTTGTLDLPALRSAIQGRLTVSGATVNWSGVTNFSGNTLTLNGGAVVNLSHVTDLSQSTFTVGTNGTVILDQVRQMDGANITVQDAQVLTLPLVTSYDAPEWDQATFVLRASGAGSVLRLPHLTNVIGDGMYNSYVVIEALAGGRVELPAVAQMTQPYNGGYSSYPRGIQVLADGTNSMVDLSGLVSFADQAPVHGSWLEARNGGTILAGQLVALSGVEVRLNAMGTLNLPALRSVVDSAVTVAGMAADWSGVTNLNQSVLTLEAGGTMNLAQASQVDGATFLVQSGTTLELPQVMDYDARELDSATFRLRASGAGSVLRLPHLTNVIGDGMHNSYVVIEALAGGRVELPAVAQMTQPYNGRYSSYPRGIQVLADGTNSMVDLSGLVDFADQAPVHGSWLEARNGGTILFSTGVHLTGVGLTVRSGGAASLDRVLALRDLTVTADGCTLAFPNLQHAENVSFQTPNGGQILFPNPADLVVTDIRAPSAAVAGQPVQVAWTVHNQSANAAVGSRSDAVYLSSDLNLGNDTLLSLFPSTGGFGPGASRSFTNTVILPGELTGTFYFVVSADSLQEVFEGDAETNNAFLSTNALALSAADLSVTSFTVTNSAVVLGQTLFLKWVVRNGGAVSGERDLARPGLSVAHCEPHVAECASGRRTSLARVAESRRQLHELGHRKPAARSTMGFGQLLSYRSRGFPEPAAREQRSKQHRESQPHGHIAVAAGPGGICPGAPRHRRRWADNSVGMGSDQSGHGAASGPWQESVYLSSDAVLGDNLLVARLNFANSLPSGAWVMRTQQIALAVTAPAGALHWVVDLDSAHQVFEQNEDNNAAISLDATVVPAQLTLQLAAAEIPENSTTPNVAGTVTRNAGLGTNLTVTLASSDSTELVVPASVSVPAGQAVGHFTVTVQPDGLFDGDQTVRISATGPGYSAVTNLLVVRDSDVPRLSLALERHDLIEGETIMALVTRENVTASPLTVNLAASVPAQLNVPGSVTIPGNQPSMWFPVTPVDDSLVEGTNAYAITATAVGCEPASATVSVTDNDIPDIAIVLMAHTVSEGAGPKATTGTITRSRNSPSPLVVALTSSDPTAALVPASVTIPAGRTNAVFNVAAVDDASVDGDQTTTLHAFVLDSVTGQPLRVGTPDTLEVTNDNGPTLRLTLGAEVVGEGLATATTATVTRNTPPGTPLVVSLSSSDTTEATVPSTVTIPANTNTATFAITTLEDGVTDGNQNVTVTASASGFTGGSSVLVVSDADLPDLVVRNLNAPASVRTDEPFSISFRLDNSGRVATGSNFVQRILLSSDGVIGEDAWLGQAEFVGTIQPGSGASQTVQAAAPHSPGDYYVVVVADVNDNVAELLEGNNDAIRLTPLHVQAAYTATVAADVHQAPAGTTIPLHGQAVRAGTGQPAAAVPVSVHLVVRGIERVFSVVTDATGAFAMEFRPLPSEAGGYTVAAAHPGVSNPAPQDTFTLYGMTISSAPEVRVNEGSLAEGSASVENLSDIPLTDLSVMVLSNPPNLTVTASLSSNSLPGDATMRLGYVVTVPVGTTTGGPARLRVNSAEGVSADLDLRISVAPLTPHLQVTPTSLFAGMSRGEQSMVQFAVTNTGGCVSGPVHVVLPSLTWLSVASGDVLPPLAPGEGAQVSLLLSPPGDLPLGPYGGTLVLTATNAGANVSFQFVCQSARVGDLRVTAVDEYTYYAEGAPKVAQATVRLIDPVSQTLLLTTQTDASGVVVLTNLTEAHYRVEVSAPDHGAHNEILLVEAARTNEVLAFLPRQTVKYFWTLEPTQIQDRTRLRIDTIFETVVPVPVVTMEPSVIDLDDMTGDETVVHLRIRNHGLVAARHLRLHFGGHINYTFTMAAHVSLVVTQTDLLITNTEPTSVCDLGDLPPGGGDLTVPVRIRRTGDAPGGSCKIQAGLVWELECGGRQNSYDVPIAIINAGHDCGEAGVGVGFRPLLPGGWLESAAFSGPSFGTFPNLCDPETLQLLLDLLDCAQHLASAASGSVESVMDLIDSYRQIQEEGPSANNALEFCRSALNTYAQNTAAFNGAVQAAECFKNTLSDAASEALRDAADDLLSSLAPVRGFFDEPAWFQCPDPQTEAEWLAEFGDATDVQSDGGYEITTEEAAQLMGQSAGASITEAEKSRLIARWNRTVTYYSLDIFYQEQVSADWSLDFEAWDVLVLQMTELELTIERLHQQGYGNAVEATQDQYHQLHDAVAGNTGGTCARVHLQLEQGAVISRDAFKATLEIVNTTGGPLENVKVILEVRDQSGQLTTGLFALRPPELSGLTAVDGTGVIPGQGTGTATWIIVPTSEAAPTTPTEHFVGGTLSYQQGGALITVPLAPTSITVLPNPKLVVRYFHQRDVVSDDPFTPVIEPSEPFSLAVMVENEGFGTAHHMRITSGAPQIIENEKGLQIAFEIIGAEVGGAPREPSLTVDLGDIGSGQIAVGRWLLRSSLQGLFTDYEATFEHLDSLGNPRLSLIDRVEIHEMIHLVQADREFEDGLPDFLVNDQGDAHDYPDTLWFSSGSNAPVSLVTAGTVDGALGPGQLSVQLTAQMPAGWAYLRLADPADGNFRLRHLRRADGTLIDGGRNAWVTDRTFGGFAQRPVPENILHVLDYNAAGGEKVYTLVYDNLPANADTTPPLSSVFALPDSSPETFAVSWAGADDGEGSGLAAFDIYVSDNGGVFSLWLPGTTRGGAIFAGARDHNYAFYSVATDQAGNREAAPGTPDAWTAIRLTNSPPVLSVPAEHVADEGAVIIIQATATDPDPLQSLTFSLVGSVPAGMTIGADTGLIRWPTGEGAGPSTNVITVVVTDNALEPLSDTAQIRLVVREVNTAPTLWPIADAQVNEGTMLIVTNVASDNDLPRNTLTFSLGAGAPAGATIDPDTGLFRWQPTALQGPSTNVIVVQVTDDGDPHLSAAQWFTVVVRDVIADVTLSLGSTNLLAGEDGALPLLLASSLEIQNLSFVLETDDAHLTNLVLQSDSAEVGALSLLDAGTNHYWVSVNLNPAMMQSGTRSLAQLAFRCQPDVTSAIVPLQLSDFVATRTDGEPVGNVAAQSGRVIVVAQEPVLDMVCPGNGAWGLVLYGRPGTNYWIEAAGELSASTWYQEALCLMTNRHQIFWLNPSTNGPTGFYRARELP